MARSRSSRASSTPRLEAASISTTSRLAEPLQMRWQESHSPHGSPVFAVQALAVERHREHAGERRLAGAAGPAEQVAVRHAVARDRALERVGDVRLDGHGREVPRTILAGEGDGHERRRRGRSAEARRARRPGQRPRSARARPSHDGRGPGSQCLARHARSQDANRAGAPKPEHVRPSHHPRDTPGLTEQRETPHAAATCGVLTGLAGSRPPGPGANGR